MERKKLRYSAGQLYECDNCKSVAKIPIDISEVVLPVVLVCPKCEGSVRWEIVPTLPKIPPVMITEWWIALDPDTILSVNSLSTGNRDDDDSQTESNKLDSAQENPQKNPGYIKTFAELAKEIRKKTSSVFESINKIHEELNAFQSQVCGFFEDRWKYANDFSRKWQPEYVGEFMDFPFMEIPLSCEDELASAYARWIISPKFFTPGIGLPVRQSGGFRLELTNQYLRMYSDTTERIWESLSLPASIQLNVVGNKITGASLPLCWRDIPGVSKDVDFTLENISVKITDFGVARRWLAQHGVCPWGKREVLRSELNYLDIDRNLFSKQNFRRVWLKFIKSGRLGIFWDDVIEMRRIATLIGYATKGVKAVFIPGWKDRMGWSNLYSTTCNSEISNFVYFHNGDPVIWDAVMKTKMVIVDSTGKEPIDWEVLDKLAAYDGKVIVICDDPLMDFASENIYAPAIHALAGFADFDWKDNTNMTWTKGHADPIIEETIRKIHKKIGYFTAADLGELTDEPPGESLPEQEGNRPARDFP